MNLPFDKQFHFRDGASVSTVRALKDKIETISYQEFYHHVNAEKNDFANWLQSVLHEEKLAEELRKVTSIVETVEIINDFLHPKANAGSDIQSRIEQTLFSSSLAVETSEKLPVEDVPTIVPEPPQVSESADFTIIEENVEPEVKEAPRQAPMQQAPIQQSSHTDADMTRMIVKDFMYGLVFGLLIGLILGKIISI